MLPYALAIAVGISSFILFLTAFFMPKIHRRDDFLWSGVGLLYALVLWFCAGKIHGAVLLGQLAAVALLSSYTWQIISLRRAIVNPEQQTVSDGFSVTEFLSNLFKRSSKSSPSTPEVASSPTEKLEKNIPQEVSPNTVAKEEVKETDVTPPTESLEVVKTETTNTNYEKPKKSGLFNKVRSFGKKEPEVIVSESEKPTNLAEIKLGDVLNEEEATESTSVIEAPQESVVVKKSIVVEEVKESVAIPENQPSAPKQETSNWEDEEEEEETIEAKETSEVKNIQEKEISTTVTVKETETIIKGESVSSESDVNDPERVAMTAELENNQESNEIPDTSPEEKS